MTYEEYLSKIIDNDINIEKLNIIIWKKRISGVILKATKAEMDRIQVLVKNDSIDISVEKVRLQVMNKTCYNTLAKLSA